MVGSISTRVEGLYGGCRLVGSLTTHHIGKIFAPLLADPDNFFIISTDFCHWGSRFRCVDSLGTNLEHDRYTPHNKQLGAIHQYIEFLDRSGMNAISSRVSGAPGWISVFDRIRTSSQPIWRKQRIRFAGATRLLFYCRLASCQRSASLCVQAMKVLLPQVECEVVWTRCAAL